MMKNINFCMALAVSAIMLQACSNNAAKNGSKANADSTNAKKDASTSPTLAITPDDATFALSAANGGLAEVELGKLAQAKATDARVKAFAAKMVTDHSMADEQLMAIAKLKNITLPTVPGTDEQRIIGDLAKKSGKDFDKAYVDAMVDDHTKDVKEFEDATKNVKDADLNAFAAKTLPTLKMHLDMITKIQAGLK